MEDEEEKIQVRYSPQALEFLSKLSETDREEFLKSISNLTDGLSKNPYLGTPLWGGPWLRTWNWVRRQVWHLKARIGL